MSESQPQNAARDEQLSQTIADYLEAEQAGHPPDRESLRKQYPDLADDLQTFFADHDRMNALASPVRPAGVEPPASHSVADEATLPPQVASDTAGVRSTAPRTGTIISYFGDYELLEEIARGGMGVVYKARQVRLNRVVALKMILTGQLASKEDVQRFHSEAEAAANLDHPGIVPIFEVGEYEKQHYFSMGYVEGNSLAGRLLDGPLPPRRAAELLRTVAEAVQYAHEKGVIHRDLKPASPHFSPRRLIARILPAGWRRSKSRVGIRGGRPGDGR